MNEQAVDNLRQIKLPWCIIIFQIVCYKRNVVFLLIELFCCLNGLDATTINTIILQATAKNIFQWCISRWCWIQRKKPSPKGKRNKKYSIYVSIHLSRCTICFFSFTLMPAFVFGQIPTQFSLIQMKQCAKYFVHQWRQLNRCAWLCSNKIEYYFHFILNKNGCNWFHPRWSNRS